MTPLLIPATICPPVYIDFAAPIPPAVIIAPLTVVVVAVASVTTNMPPT